MLSRSKLALVGLLALILCAIVLFFPAAAGAGTTVCYLYPGTSCSTSWNYWSGHYVINNSSNGYMYCYSLHPDGSLAGAYGQVNPGAARPFWSGGYNRMTCEWFQGGYPIYGDIVS
jgi:hypothetical protein